MLGKPMKTRWNDGSKMEVESRENRFASEKSPRRSEFDESWIARISKMGGNASRMVFFQRHLIGLKPGISIALAALAARELQCRSASMKLLGHHMNWSQLRELVEEKRAHNIKGRDSGLFLPIVDRDFLKPNEAVFPKGLILCPKNIQKHHQIHQDVFHFAKVVGIIVNPVSWQLL